jgi:DNA-binding MarR family transcriptional regulator
MSKKRLEPETLEKCLGSACLSFRQAYRAVSQLFDDALVPVGMPSAQLPVLIVAAVYGPLTITRLANLLVIDRTTLTRIIKPLQTKGYLRSIATPDKRKNMLELTPKGHEILVEAYPLWLKAQEQIVLGLKPKNWEMVKYQLGQVVKIANARGLSPTV